MKKVLYLTSNRFFIGRILPMLILVLGSFIGHAQILTFEFNTGGSLTSNTNSANITSSTISYTTGTLTSATTPPTSFTVSNWVNAATIAADEYFQFTITPVTNGSFTVSTMVFNYSRATNGPQTLAIRNSLDNYASDIATATVTNNGTTAQVLTVNINQTTSSSAVTYRIYAYVGAGNNTGAGGFSGTGNDIVVNGTATSSNFSGSAVISRAGRASICLGDSSSIALNITGGVPPYTVQTIDNLGLLRTFTGVRTNTPIYVYPQESKTYSISSLTDSNGQSLLAANFSGSGAITVTSSPVATTVGNYSRNLTHNDGLTLTYADGSQCKSWVKIQDALGGNVLGSTTCTADVYASLQKNSTERSFLARKINIAPTTNGNAVVTLFYTQAEFSAYNAAITYTQKLPATSTDTVGVTSKLIIRRTANSIETDSLTSFTPDSVRWNGTNSQWEVTFQVNDGLLSGNYYVSTPFTSTKMVTGLTHNTATPVSGNTSASVTIDWNDVVDVTQYRLRYRAVGGNWNPNTITGSQRVLTLAFNTTYEVQVRVYESGSVQGEYTRTYTFTTPSDPGKLPDCTIPTNITTTINSAVSATINWTAASQAATYLVEMRPKNTLVWGGSSTSTTSKTFVSLSPSTTYEFRIRTHCTPGTTENGTSVFSAVDTFRTSAMAPCGAVQNLTTSSVTANSVGLQWSSVSFATGYQVQLRLKNTAVWGGTTTAGTSFTFNNLSGSSTYEYRVRAFCNNTPALTTTTSGAFTTVGEFTTSATPVLATCLAPTNVVVTPSLTTLAMSWDSAANANRYFLNIKQASSSTWGGTTSYGLSYTFSNLAPATNYHIRLRTVCNVGTTVNSNSAFTDTIFTATTALPNKMINGHIDLPIAIYPNPTRDILQIDYSSNTSELVRVLVLDVTGRTVYTTEAKPLIGENNITLNLSMLQDGIYVVRVLQGNEVRFVGQVTKTNR
jgi:hypothetical protein